MTQPTVHCADVVVSPAAVGLTASCWQPFPPRVLKVPKLICKSSFRKVLEVFMPQVNKRCRRIVHLLAPENGNPRTLDESVVVKPLATECDRSRTSELGPSADPLSPSFLTSPDFRRVGRILTMYSLALSVPSARRSSREANCGHYRHLTER